MRERKKEKKCYGRKEQMGNPMSESPSCIWVKNSTWHHLPIPLPLVIAQTCVRAESTKMNQTYSRWLRLSDWSDLIWSDVLGTMLPAGPTKMNKDLNSKFCFQKQMSCSRTWTKKWGRVRTQYNGYYSKTKTQKITSVGEDTEILEPLCIASKNVEWSSCYTKQFGGSSQN